MTYKILIVDDQSSNLETIVQHIEESNEPFDILQALQAQTALIIAQNELPDIIITDWEMPVMDGIELIRELRKIEQTKDIPVIMCTGVMTSSHNLNTALEAGAVDYIRKPIDKIELIARIKANLHLSDKYKQIQALNQKLIKLSQFKEDMTKMLIHDLKNPLVTILNSEIIPEDERVEITKYSGYKMLNLIHNVLDVYRYETTSFNLEKQRLIIRDLIDSAQKEVKYILSARNISFDVDQICDCSVEADGNMLIRVFSNILSNAVKYAPEKSAITIKCYELDNDFLKISVHNAGDHIPEELQETIFERFGQGEGQQHENISSSGLGLTFCKLAIEAHGGVIGVDSSEGNGATFWLTLPISVSDKTSNNITLSDDDKAVLKENLPALLKLSVFELSSTKKVLRDLESKLSGNCIWLKKAYSAIDECNQEAFLQLLDSIR
ncbi:hybrid sensor histidine kinase/response regulator [Carboxylicivirga sp. N1Y90]|uniref:hybrid sensor histidine kinase/response regulator n=1 Tax=Carboxylicivirga fragile TaxID=3417571 RepID=UPI003D3297FC|nr:hybrid sensor histidine kinase/response regulator [Marinilabiliaceae bacterium N1Y90]